ncbi:VWFA and cache domain-containing protein 1-like isoform X2 [Sycon ciliatum]|uniref:VWFA and cache domain-containing protein 1-like isoform X2 n=1 Tax=Sycon ciliatum TaxID=27933 RepID=UPI0031F60F83
MWRSYLIIVCSLLGLQLLCSTQVTLGQTFSTISSSQMQQRLRTFSTSALSVQAMQELYNNNAELSTSPALNGATIANNLATQVASRLTSRLSIVTSLRSRARDAYNGGQTSSTLTECCRLSRNSVSFDARFNQTVNLDNGCDRISASASSSRSTISSTITAEAKAQLNRVPEARFQYFGSEEGYATLYPGINITDCSDYDPRFRPWYVASAVPTPKDLVIVVDVSGSMGDIVPNSGRQSRLDLAKVAVASILNTLSDRDRVTVVPFSDIVESIGGSSSEAGCFDSELGLVSPYSVRLLTRLVNGLNANGGTRYATAIEAAYERLDVPELRPERREKVIIFLTDGAPSDGSQVLPAQRIAAAKFQYTVTVLTYALGPSISDPTLLSNMAAQRYGSGFSLPSSGAVGRYQQIADFNNLRGSLSLYYSFFATEVSTSSTTITMPYYDAFGLGAILTVAAPVYAGPTTNLRLAGVVGVDVTVSDLFGDISYFSDAEHQYAFMINNDGEAVLHPLLSLPVDLSTDPLFQDITLLEPDAAFRSNVYMQMRNRTTGSATFTATRFQMIGNSQYEGTVRVSVMSSYYWQPISGTEFIVGVVLNHDASNEVDALINQARSSVNTLYHRLDLNVRGQRCSQFGHLAVRDLSAVKFSPEAFLNPSQYLNVPETSQTVSSYLSYLDGNGANSYFKDTIRNSVRLTSALDALWNSPAAGLYSRSVVWRYIGSIDGMFRIIPGTQLPTAYDHLRRDWFTRALSNPGDITLSPPYLDAFGAGYVATLSQSIHQSVNRSVPAVGAVMGVDFTMGFLGLTIEQVYPECRNTYRCVIVDRSGYLVYHPDFVTTGQDPQWVHLGRKEPYLMRDLQGRGFAQRINCAKYDVQTRYVSWRISVTGRITGTLTCSESVPYVLEPISGTNVYIAFMQSTGCSQPNNNVCQCNSNGLGRCTRSSLCECPCTRDLDYSACTNSFTGSSLVYDVCPAEIAGLPVIPRQPSSIVGLEGCFNGTCSGLTQSSDCRATQGCAWCTRSASGTELSSSFCTTDCQCFGGRQGEKNPSGNCVAPQGGGDGDDDDSGSGGLSGGAIGGIVVGVVVVCFIVFIVISKSSSGGSSVSSSQPAVRTSAVKHTQPAAASYGGAPEAPSGALRRPSEPTAPAATSYNPPPASNPAAPPDYSAAVNIGSDFQSTGYSAAPYPSSTTAPYPSSTTAPYPSSNLPYPSAATSGPYPPSTADPNYPTKPAY